MDWIQNYDDKKVLKKKISHAIEYYFLRFMHLWKAATSLWLPLEIQNSNYSDVYMFMWRWLKVTFNTSNGIENKPRNLVIFSDNAHVCSISFNW